MHGLSKQFGTVSTTMAKAAPLRVAVVDDDPGILDALRVTFEIEGCSVSTFSSGEQFLASADRNQVDCLLLDMTIPGSSGMQVLNAVGGQSYHAPVIMISGLSNIPMAVAAIRAGAYDFIEKPFDADVVERVREGARKFRERNSTESQHSAPGLSPCADTLTSREKDVLALIIEGLSNKETARLLSISPRTVEVHRARITEKFGARNTADLMRIVLGGCLDIQ